MNFKEALTQILQNEDGELSGNPVWLYSRLSDLCSSYADTQKISLLYEVDKRLNIVRSVLSGGNGARAALKAAYPAVKEVITEESYQKLLICVGEAAFPQANKKPQPAVQKPNAAQKTKTAAAKNSTAPSPAVKRAAAPKVQAKKAKSRRKRKPRHVFIWVISIIAALILAAGVVCLCVFGKSFNWASWQHIIGSIGGLLLFAGITFLIIFIDDELLLDFYAVGFFLLLAIAVGNFTLLIFLRSNYKIIFIWLSGFELAWGALLAFATYGDFEERWAIADAVEWAALLVAMILGIVLL